MLKPSVKRTKIVILVTFLLLTALMLNFMLPLLSYDMSPLLLVGGIAIWALFGLAVSRVGLWYTKRLEEHWEILEELRKQKKQK